MTNLAQLLATSAEAHPTRPAIRMDAHVLTYAELEAATGAVAAILHQHGLTTGDRVGVMLPNIPAFAAISYGVLRMGGVVVPMNPLLKDREVAYYLSDSGAKLIFAWAGVQDSAIAGAQTAGATCEIVTPGEFEARLAATTPDLELVDRADDDTAVILYTSGTTGQPKGAELTHAALNSNREIAARTLIALSPDDVVMGCLPLFHVFGFTAGLNATLGAGGCLTLIPRFDPIAALSVIERDRVTIFEGVPTMFAALNQAVAGGVVADTSSMRVSVSGGSAMPPAVLHAFEETFGCVVLEGYGLSETSPAVSFNHPDRERKPGSIGTPIEGVQMRLVDDAGLEVSDGAVGEIQVKGPNVMKGYWGRPTETAAALSADGWFSTGDLAERDEDGYYTIVDRKKDLIIRGGYNVYPREIEDVLYEHPGIAEAAVVGLPHDTLGEEVGAVISLKPGAQATPEEIIAFVRERVAAYKYPRTVWIWDALPKSATGKILRREVRPSATS
ncbi:MAG: long-chain fatty acid--CoA ligase [Phycicoccus sp.]|nr:long-chain fatty acid--CoA ligase [Phycicoccus sp.]